MIVRIFLNGTHFPAVSLGGKFKTRKQAIKYINEISIIADFIATINGKPL